jgi:hypothetical protein
MNINLNTFLTEEQRTLCMKIAKERLDMKRSDHQAGDFRASYSFGKAGTGKERSYEQELKDNYMGTLGECISSILTKTNWTQELGQYKGNSNPDLSVIFKGRKIKAECRATRYRDAVIYRDKDKNLNAGKMLIAITNLPDGPECKVVYASFNFLIRSANAHPEWMGNNPGAPYYKIPLDYFSDDFSKFGN